MTMRWPVTEGTLLSYAVRSSLITTSPTTTTSHVWSNHHFDPFPKSDPTPACLYGAFQILIDHSRNRPIYSCRPRLDDHIHHARANVCILASDMTLSRHATSPIQLLSRSISLCLTLSLTLAFPLSPQTWIHDSFPSNHHLHIILIPIARCFLLILKLDIQANSAFFPPLSGGRVPSEQVV